MVDKDIPLNPFMLQHKNPYIKPWSIIYARRFLP